MRCSFCGWWLLHCRHSRCRAGHCLVCQQESRQWRPGDLCGRRWEGCWGKARDPPTHLHINTLCLLHNNSLKQSSLDTKEFACPLLQCRQSQHPHKELATLEACWPKSQDTEKRKETWVMLRYNSLANAGVEMLLGPCPGVLFATGDLLHLQIGHH